MSNTDANKDKNLTVTIRSYRNFFIHEILNFATIDKLEYTFLHLITKTFFTKLYKVLQNYKNATNYNYTLDTING